jgi:hypothetical protein
VHALVSLWQWTEIPGDELPPELERSIASLVRQSPGYAEGYWTYERANGKSIGFVLLETAEQAHDLKNAIESHMEVQGQRGIRLEMIRVQEIVTHLPARSVPAPTA